MPSPLALRLAALKEATAHQADPVPAQLVGICDALYELIEQNRNDLTEAYEAQIRLDERIGELEKRMPPYQGAR